MKNENYTDVEKLKVMIADYRQKTPPDIKEGVDKELNSAIICVYAVMASTWLIALYFQNFLAYFLAVIYSAIVLVTVVCMGFPPVIITKNISAVWERDYVNDADIEVISECSEDFREFLLQSTNNDLSNLTYTRLENIVDKYNAKHEQIKIAALSKERLKLS
ncbi:hypothetical protein IPU80_004511 [Escherichia coli]|nr:hypothetical protein [Escherichia coli]